MASEKVSVIVPAYNEEEVLGQNVKSLKRTLDGFLDDFEIIISEDGSTDRTAEIARSLKSENVRVLHNRKRAGKGAAIKSAAAYTRGDIVLFMDADLASNPEQVRDLVSKLESGADVVVGSRYHKGSKTRRSFIRYFASRSFNALVRVLLGSRISDHQCGFKAFRKRSVLPIIDKVENQKWFWDTEFLVLAQRNGLRVDEIPIRWEESPNSKFRLFRDTVHMAGSLISFKLRRR